MFRIMFRRRVMRRRRPARRRSKASRADYASRKEAARELIIARIAHFTDRYAALDPSFRQALAYERLAVRNVRTRWGSCSSKKNLNFNYRILDLPPELQDYVVVHELCHLVELHHGRPFWDLMERVIPDAKAHHRLVRKVSLV